MLIDFRCRRCRAPLSLEADQKGNRVHCPTCDCEMVVPPASEPDAPRGQIIQGVYAVLGVGEADKEASPATSDGLAAGEPGYALQPDPILPPMGDGTMPQPLPDQREAASGDSIKEKRKRRKRRDQESSSQSAGRWSRRAPVLAGTLVLVIVVTCSAKRVRHEADADSSVASEAPAPVVEAISPASPVSFNAASTNVEPIVQKERGKEAKEAEKATVKRDVGGEKASRAEAERVLREAAKQQVPIAPAAPARPSLDNSLAQSEKFVVKRRRNLSEEDLRKELHLTPQIPNLDMSAMNRLVGSQKVNVEYFKYIDHEPNLLLKVRPDLKSLPVRKGRSCELDKRSAVNLGIFSQKLHVLADNPRPEEGNDQHAMPGLLRKFMDGEVRGKRSEWLRPEAIPALQQILMQESKPLRWLLVEILAEIPGPAASVALAQRALFDLSPEVRAMAIQALKTRPREQYRQVLVNGLRYPWAPVADHAAEALVALHDQEVIPTLVAYLKEADPSEASSSSKSQTLWREMVRINHAANCLMCHPPAARLSDPVTAPVPGLTLIGSVQRATGHYGSLSVSIPTQSSFWVRVDITYLRQDFSIRERVKSPGTELVAYPRFDYLVRTRKVKPEEARELKSRSAKPQQREAILFALRELTGADAGAETNAWVKLYPPAKLDEETNRLKANW